MSANASKSWQALDRIRQRLLTASRRHGKKALVGLIAYYLIRDLLIYVVLPAFLLSR